MTTNQVTIPKNQVAAFPKPGSAEWHEAQVAYWQGEVSRRIAKLWEAEDELCIARKALHASKSTQFCERHGAAKE